jgi:hypothetical protein
MNIITLLFLLFILYVPVSANSSTIYGLDFPGSSAVKTTIRFKFTNPQPFGKGLTYIWKAYPRAQQDPTTGGYYTTFFWGNDDGGGTLDTFLWKNRNTKADSYYGVHPYPRYKYTASSVTDWEISVEQRDYVNGQVEYGRWYKQALVVWSDEFGKHHKFYWDLPKTDSSHTVSRLSPPDYGNANPPSPALTWGDAPWNPGKEVYCGILRGIQIYSTKLTVADLISESEVPLSTATGVKNIWYLNSNPTPTDISDKSGRDHHPEWVGSERPSLFSSEKEPLYTMREKTNYFPAITCIVISLIALIFTCYFCLLKKVDLHE